MVDIVCDINDTNCKSYKHNKCILPFNKCTHQKKLQKVLPLWNDNK